MRDATFQSDHFLRDCDTGVMVIDGCKWMPNTVIWIGLAQIGKALFLFYSCCVEGDVGCVYRSEVTTCIFLFNFTYQSKLFKSVV